MNEKATTKILERLLREPIVTIILIAYSIFMGIMLKLMWDRLDLLQTKLDGCQGYQVELLRTVVKDNTDAMNNFKEELKDLRK
jgi:hypothetical protein